MPSKKGIVSEDRLTFGLMQVDWEPRIDFEKMRKERLERARDAMKKFGLDYLLLCRQENGRYVTGIKRLYWPTIRLGAGPVIVLPLEGNPGVWIIDIAFQARVLPWLPSEGFREPYDMDEDYDVEAFVHEALEMFGASLKDAVIGVDVWSPAMYKVLPKKLPKAKFVDGKEVMVHARTIKSPEEISCIKMAAVISEAGMQAAVDILKPGVKECELAGACFNKFWQLGSETTQCSQVVNSGPGTLPYRRFQSDRIIQAGDLLNMDFGACFNGYFGDFSRAFVCGKKPSRKQLNLMRDTHKRQMELFESIRPGVIASELCKKFGRKQVGHGIGMGGQEPPTLHMKQSFPLQPGMVFSVGTPGKAEGVGTVHMEDQIAVTEKGCEVISTYPYAGVDD